ncbi:MAG: putative ubiquitin-like protein YukD [Myxococcota bacterium]|jgi:uncharacterized ubiquitin-like protein YukD
MSVGGYQVPQDAGTVQVHVQVIDLEPFSLDMVVPTYLPAKDLTQRVARDAGLGAFWDDGTRRRFYLRARGRLLEEHEKLEELGIVAGELLHLLPEPPEGSGVEERPPEYPPNRGYTGAGNAAVAGSLLVVLVWTAAWSIALTATQGVIVGLFPGIGLALLATSLARHTWGGLGSSVRIPLTGLFIFLPLLILAALPAFALGVDIAALAMAIGPAFVGGMFGVLLGWLAWYGAVEPLPKVTEKQVKAIEAQVTWPCGICGGPVTPDVKADCGFGCGRVFHTGCMQAKQAMAAGNGCAICGFQPA